MGRKGDSSENAKVRDVLELLRRDAQLNKEQVEFCSEVCIQRYLRARSGNVRKAAKQLRSTLSWRESLEIGYLTADDFPPELAAGVAFVAGFDDNERPVLVLRTGLEFPPSRSQKRFLRFLVFSFEVALASMRPGVEQWTMIIDFRGFSKPSSSLMSLVLTILKLISDHYPGRLAQSFFVDAPSMFYYLWKGMGPFIDHSTRENWSFAFLKDHVERAPSTPGTSCSPDEQRSSSLANDFYSATPSFRYHTTTGSSYEERLSVMNFLTPLSSPGGQSFFARNLDHSLGAALTSEVQHRSLSFSSPAKPRTPFSAAEIEDLGYYGSPVFLTSRSRRCSSREGGMLASLLKRESARRTSSSGSSNRFTETFRPYVKFCKAEYNEHSYRASMKPPLGGLLSVIKSALNLNAS